MAKFTKALRQRIIENFARSNNGWFDPVKFVDHVRDTGPSHEAYAWFEWDDVAAAERHRVEQAREFARGLRVSFEVIEEPTRKMHVTSTSEPLLDDRGKRERRGNLPGYHSPIKNRSQGGGYIKTDPDDPEHVANLVEEAAEMLRQFLDRHAWVLHKVGIEVEALEDVEKQLLAYGSGTEIVRAAE